MSKPFFSIVIPTRQRHETLPYAIKTVLQQEFDDYEIVVADNCSSSETYEVVHSFNNPKIKYFRSEIPLAMSDNWELALSKVLGDYTILFGDDDGLVNYALGYLYEIINKTQFQVVCWNRSSYFWPHARPVEFSNFLSIPIPGYNYIHQGINTLKSYAKFRTDYSTLPMLYNSAVSTELLLRLKEKTGRFFRSLIPDLYSGCALAYLSESYILLGVPCSINGSSAKSNGMSFFSQPFSDKVNQDWQILNSNCEIKFHAQVPNVRSSTSGIIEPLLQVKDVMHDLSLKIDMTQVYKKILRDIIVYNEYEQEQAINLIREAIYNSNLIGFFHSFEWKKFQPQIKTLNSSSSSQAIGFNNSFISLDASKFKIFDVYQASQFVSHFYTFSDYETQFFRKPWYSRLSRRVKLALNILIYGK
jgi:glycosyltransferase involved in cell wall biosynthesis